MTKILIIGYGAMGRALHQHAESHGCHVVGVHDLDTAFDPDNTEEFDVAIDFTEPSAVLDNARLVSSLGKGLVIGTTGWYESIKEVRQLAALTGTGIIYGTNFSIGVQIFFRLLREAGSLINEIDDYDVMLHEWHHNRKKDSPSGTALTAAKTLLEVIERKKSISTEAQHDRIDASALHVTSSRGGEIVGRHILTIDGTDDSIEIKHDAKTRMGFVNGALMAARWIHGKQGLYDFSEVFHQIHDEHS